MRSKRGRLDVQKRGSAVLLGVLVVLIVASAATVFLSSEDNNLTGAVIGLQTIQGECNITVRNTINNIGHDYECEGTHGFIFEEDNLVFDCQDHTIKCVSNCDGTAGLLIQNRSNITIKNCNVYNFTDGARLNQGASNNLFEDNEFQNNSAGIFVDNATANEFRKNIIDNNLVCGINISNMANNPADNSTFNEVWNNKIWNSSGGIEACSDANSHNFWYNLPICGDDSTGNGTTYDQAGLNTSNIMANGVDCRAGNWWASYTGLDQNGDGFGDNNIPYKGGSTTMSGDNGDKYPLTFKNSTPSIVCEDHEYMNESIISDSGEGIAVICDNAVVQCVGTAFNGNGSDQSSPYADDMRGIEIKNVNNVTVIGCEFYNYTYGVYIQNAYNVNLINVTVHDNNQTGILIGSLSYNVTINGSTIYDSGNGLQKVGIDMQNAQSADNGGGNNLIVSSTISNHTTAGIRIRENSDSNTISSNTIFNNTDAILVNNSDGNSIYNNVLRNNSHAGLYAISSNLSDQGNADNATRNTVYGNTYGYYLNTVSAGPNGITGIFYDNDQRALYVGDSDPNIRDIWAYSNGNGSSSTYTLFINSSENIDLYDINISDSYNGLYVLNSANITLSNDGSIDIFNNTIGIYFLTVNNSVMEEPLTNPITGLPNLLYIHNNTQNIVLSLSDNNTIVGATVVGGTYGIDLLSSDDNNITKSNISSFTGTNFNLVGASNNYIYNNIIDNSTGGTDVSDDGSNNFWNVSYTQATNILGGAYIGGNYWSEYSGVDTTPDGIGDDPDNYTTSSGNVIDYLPLTNVIGTCGTVTTDVTFTQNITANESCIIIGAHGITLDFQGYSLIGPGSGIGINISDYSNVTVKNATIENFTTAIYVDPATGINLSLLTIQDGVNGIIFDQINESFIYNNTLQNLSGIAINLTSSYNNTLNDNTVQLNALGLDLTTSHNNSIYNNLFNNTDDARDDGSINFWNTSYTVADNIVGGNHTGGNFWSTYSGKDIGGGTYPNNVTGDGIGDTLLPFTDSSTITGGDYLPLSNENGTQATTCQTITETTLLTSDINCTTGDGVTIAADDITLDCNGQNINGDGTGAGISVENRDNIIIRNCNITNFYYGIKVTGSESVQIIEGNDLRQNDFYGIYLYQSNHTKIDGNMIINDNNGVYSISSYNTTITNNEIDLQKKFYAVYLFKSNLNNITNNTMLDNYHGIYLVNSSNTTADANTINTSEVYSIFLHKSSSDGIFSGNSLADGKFAVQIKESSASNSFINNTIQDHATRGIYISTSNYNSFINNTVSNNFNNVYLVAATNTNFTNNSVLLGETGIDADFSSNSLYLERNTVNSTSTYALQVDDSSVTARNNTLHQAVTFTNADGSNISNNNVTTSYTTVNSSNTVTISSNEFNDLNVTEGSAITISSNTIEDLYVSSLTSSSSITSNTLNSLTAVTFTSGNISSNTVENQNATAFDLQAVTSSTISANTIENTTTAILLYSSSNSNTLYDNWVKDNSVGLNITNSSSNTIYNNYFENTNNIEDDSSNTWYTSYSCASPNIVGGPCRGGNFYSDYYGLDNGANGREEGDGVGDLPANYTVASGTYDLYPLVLYVSRQYFHPDSSNASSMVATSNVTGNLSDAQVVANQVQVVNYSLNNITYAQVTGLFNQSDVDADTLLINIDENKTGLSKNGATGLLSNYSLFLYHNYSFDAGVYVCPGISNLSAANSTCSSRVNLTSIGSTSGYILSLSGPYYQISNISSDDVVVVLDNADACDSNIIHNVTLTENVSCASDGLTIAADNITVDCAGYTINGSDTGNGIHLQTKSNITIEQCTIRDFNVGIKAYRSPDLVIEQNTIDDNKWGIHIQQTNGSLVRNNTFLNNGVFTNTVSSGVYIYPDSYYNVIANNTIINNYQGLYIWNSHNNTIHTNNITNSSAQGIEITSGSTYNLIYNNYFNNTNSSVSTNSTNLWNTSYNCSAGPNILGGSCMGGNFWTSYTGWDTDLDGVGDTLVPYNQSGDFEGDSLPLLDVGYIACSGTSQNVTTNITLNRNLTSNGRCFTLDATIPPTEVVFDCAGHTISGNGTGEGIYVDRIDDLIVKNCRIESFEYGILDSTSINSTFTNNTITNISTSALYGWGGSNKSFINNSIMDNTGDGIRLTSVHTSLIVNNTVTNNGDGIQLVDSNNNSIYSNSVKNNSHGIRLQTPTTENNTIYNNHFNNTNNVNISSVSGNFWNISYNCSTGPNILGDNCMGGNFWSNYAGEDNGSGSYPYNESADGIGDTDIPYDNSGEISTGDYLPLVSTSVCGDGNVTGSEVCDGTNFGGLDCTNYGYTVASGLSCTNSCFTINTSACTNSSGSSSSSSSSSSSGGGGGGGGGSSSSKAECNDNKDNDGDGLSDYPEDPGCSSTLDDDETDGSACTQSWVCSSWSTCSAGSQTRDCYDLNACQEKLNSGEAPSISTTPKPIESQSCEAQTSQQPTTQEQEPEEPTFLPSVITEPGTVRTVAISGVALLAVMGGVYTAWFVGHPSNRLRRRLKKLNPRIGDDSAHILKDSYIEVYNLYLKLSEGRKKNFYGKVAKMREKIEDQLKAEKNVQKLFEKAKEGDVKERRKTYLSIYDEYKKLPKKIQKEYYPKIVDLREELEGTRKK